MNNTTKVAVVFHMNGDQLEGGVYTVEQLVMGQHLEWMKEMEEKYGPNVEWSVRDPRYVNLD
jgi:hypothetical protein